MPAVSPALRGPASGRPNGLPGHTPLPLAVCLLLAGPAWAAAAEPPITNQVLVTGNALSRSSPDQASSVLTGEALAQRKQGTLGDTLDGLPGVAASGFGPQASRPVIRGLDGDRIRLLDNGGASADASNLSFDHAVAVDPLVIERIEVLRGPAALLYGGNATGGVVNTLDNRIPRDALTGLGGRAELRLGGAAREQATAALLEGGAQGLNWHVDAANRTSDNLRTPRFVPEADGQARPATGQVVNSAGHSQAGAVGLSWADAQGFAGLSVDGLRNRYGVTVEPDVTIRMQRQRVQAAGEQRWATGPWSALSWQGSQTRYQHQELEGDGSVGTTFASTGRELRAQARQAPRSVAGGQWQGVLGTQLEQLAFSALGSEAFVPATDTRSQALFTLQEWAGTAGTLSAGWRREAVQVASRGDAPGLAGPHFGAAQGRRFAPQSWSLGVASPQVAGWHAGATWGHTERAPAYYELFAQGPHVATGTWERGDASLAAERSGHLEATLQWQGQPGQHIQATAYRTRFDRYLAMLATGQTVATEGGDLPEYRYTALAARMQGVELAAQQRWSWAGWRLEAQASWDVVRGEQRATAEPLPRLPPQRLASSLTAASGPWRWGLGARHLARQARVPANDVPTPSATLLDVWCSWQPEATAWGQAQWWAKASNVGNALAYSASTVRTARELAPAGARALSVGVRWAL